VKKMLATRLKRRYTANTDTLEVFLHFYVSDSIIINYVSCFLMKIFRRLRIHDFSGAFDTVKDMTIYNLGNNSKSINALSDIVTLFPNLELLDFDISKLKRSIRPDDFFQLIKLNKLKVLRLNFPEWTSSFLNLDQIFSPETLTKLFFNGTSLSTMREIDSDAVKITFPDLKWLSIEMVDYEFLKVNSLIFKFYPNVNIHWENDRKLNYSISIYDEILKPVIEQYPNHCQETCTLTYRDLRSPHIADVLGKWVNLKRLKIYVHYHLKTDLECPLAEISLSSIMSHAENLSDLEIHFQGPRLQLCQDSGIRARPIFPRIQEEYENIHQKATNDFVNVFAEYGSKVKSFLLRCDRCNVKDEQLVALINCFPNITDLSCKGFVNKIWVMDLLNPLERLETIFYDSNIAPRYENPVNFFRSLYACAKKLKTLKMTSDAKFLMELNDLDCFDERLQSLDIYVGFRHNQILETWQAICSIFNKTQPKEFSLAVESYPTEDEYYNYPIQMHDLLFNSSIIWGESSKKAIGYILPSSKSYT